MAVSTHSGRTKSGKRQRWAFIYLIELAGTVKIGRAASPEARIRGLQTGSAGALRLFRTWRVPSDQAQSTEKALHGLFEWARIRRSEWFSLRAVEATPAIEMYLHGDQDAAETLSAATCFMLRAASILTNLDNRVRGTHWRRRGEDWSAVRASLADAAARYDRSAATAISLGYPVGAVPL